jgi:hypothetical protein
VSRPDSARFLAEWHRVVAEKDTASIGDLLAPEVRLGAPPYWKKLEGKPVVEHLLGLILHTIEGFTYHREWVEGAELALEFTGRVGDRDLQGIDLISLDEEGRVRSLDVLMRPVNGVIALREAIAPKMAAFLSGAAQTA